MLAADLKKPALRSYLAASKDFASGAQTPRQFLEDSLVLFEQWEPKIGAFVCTSLPAARAAADRAAERWRAGEPRSAIDGMPVGIKDIIETVDMPTQMGSALFLGLQVVGYFDRDADAFAIASWLQSWLMQAR
jgi:Asp-tRNA(Asn)/Glu-tRNA(Gln) amidotransferase A subunit family amidase